MSDQNISHAGVADPHYVGPLERDITERIAAGDACAHLERVLISRWDLSSWP